MHTQETFGQLYFVPVSFSKKAKTLFKIRRLCYSTHQICRPHRIKYPRERLNIEEYYLIGYAGLAVMHVIREISAALAAILAFLLSVYLQMLVQVRFLREGLLAAGITTCEGPLLRMYP